MMNASDIRAKAAQLREHASEYSVRAGWPLLSRAYALDRLAAELERNGLERRRARLTLKELEALVPKRVFGRRAPLIQDGPAA